jgi:hypothetical protein
MKTMKRVLRYIVSPIVLVLILVTYTVHAFYQWLMFLLHGGEFITYLKDDRGSIEKIYKELKVIYDEPKDKSAESGETTK